MRERTLCSLVYLEEPLRRQLPDKLRHLRCKVLEVELFQHQSACSCILRQSEKIVAACLQDLKTERRMPKGVGGVCLSVGIRVQTRALNEVLEHL